MQMRAGPAGLHLFSSSDGTKSYSSTKSLYHHRAVLCSPSLSLALNNACDYIALTVTHPKTSAHLHTGSCFRG